MLVATFASSTLAADPVARLTTVDRNIPAARFVEATADGRLVFAVVQTDGGAEETVAVAVADLVAWGAPVEFGRHTYAVTVDGGVFAAETVAVTGETFDLLSPVFETRELPLGSVRGVVFHPPAARASRDRLFRDLAAPGEGDRDRLLLIGGDEVQGTLTALDSRHASLETAVGPAQIDLGRTAALTFNPALAARIDLPSPRLVVGLKGGSLVTVASLSGRDRIRLSPLIAPKSPNDNAAGADRPWEVDRTEIVFVQTLGGRATYLSDLEPLGYKHVPYLDTPRDYRLDESPGGGDLRAGGRRYLKGVGMFSTSRLTFPLDEMHKQFAAEIAVDDETGGRGSVTMRVFVDAEERSRSEIVRGGDAPQPITVDVAGGKTLSLIVDFAEEADVLDHADWLNARLVP